uniref:Tail tape measure protein n=1 Tax=viral metagenome TaxID=1070528 RepID=A0A6M3L3X3_9ZZZZ
MASYNDNVNINLNAKDKTQGVLDKIKGSIVGIGAAYLGWRAVTGVIGSIIEKGRESEKVWTDVEAALKRHGHALDSNLPKIKKFADEMQTLTGISDEVIGKSVQGFIDYGQSVDEAMKTAQVAIDLAAGAGMELSSATDLLSKAAVGYTSTLSRYGIIIDENIPKSEKFAAAVKQITDRFGGAAEARADTYAVRIGVLTQRFGDLQEKLFELFSPALLAIVNSLVDAVTAFMGVVDDLADFFDGAGDSILGMSRAFENLIGVSEQGNQHLIDIENAISGISDAAQKGAQDITAFAQTSEQFKKLEEVAKAIEAGTIDTTVALDYLNLGLEQIEFSSADATAAVVNGFNFAQKSVLQTGEVAALTEEQINQMMFGTKAATDSNTENVRAGMIAASEYVGAYTRTSVVDQQQAYDDMMASGEEYNTASYNQWGLLTKNVVKSTQRQGDETQKTYKEMSGAAKAFGTSAMNAADGASNRIIGSLGFLHTESTGIWKNMAADFMQYFVKEILKMAAGPLVGGVLKILGGIFDTPSNDRMAARQGRHFAQWFTYGVTDELRTLDMASALSIGGASGISRTVGRGIQSSGGNAVNITINIQGSITADSQDYVQTILLPSITQAVNKGYGNLQTADEFETIQGGLSLISMASGAN